MKRIGVEIRSWFWNTKEAARKFYSWLAVFLGLIFLILTVDKFNFLWIILLFFLIFFLIILSEFKKILIFMFLAGIFLIIYWLMTPKIDNQAINFEAKVVDKVSFGNFVEYKSNKIFIRGQNQEIGTNLWISGVLSRPRNQSDFDLVTYLKSKGSLLVLDNPKVNVLETSKNIFTKIRNFFKTDGRYSKQLIPMIFLAETPPEANDFRKWLVNLGVYQIFVISGFHINLFKKAIFVVSKAFKIKHFIYKPLFFAFLLFQLFLFNFAVSFLRGFIFWSLIEINKLFLNKKLNKIELLSISGIVILSTNPLIFYSIGFVLTFTISFVILIINQISFSKKWHKFIVQFLFINFFSAAFSAFLNSQYNFIAPLNVALFTPFFTLLYTSLFIFIFNPIIIEWICKSFIQTVEYINDFQFLTWNIRPSLSFLLFSCIISLICFLSLEVTITLSRKKFQQSQNLKILK
ncbi:ComEC/Rec2 family competence protein [Mesomycoplasma hyopneumoniae]|nr:ComEC/Rec2 family competence protein [Mesomycoplasma hyopneumoniae]